MTSKKEKVSPWQPANSQPVKKGVYQRRFSTVDGSIFDEEDDENMYHYFDGKHWFIFGIDRQDAMREYHRGNRDMLPKYAEAEWRGILG